MQLELLTRTLLLIPKDSRYNVRCVKVNEGKVACGNDANGADGSVHSLHVGFEQGTDLGLGRIGRNVLY